jgi:sterol desaturase/sphingolipid hydroxylase (fatty acid hydroxylase superfamily)
VDKIDKLPDPMAFAVPFFVLLIVLEMVWAKRRAPESYEPKDTFTSLMFGLGSQVIGALTAFAVVAFYMKVYEWRVASIPFAWWSWILCFVLDDFLYYVFHRTAHRVRWFWAAHVNHHSSQHYNLSTALRQSWTGFFALSFLFDIPLFLLGFPPEMIIFTGALNLIYQFWIHTEAIDRMPRWFEAIMNTPSHHRVHHATNPRYLDRNYAGVFIIWDKMFGTFAAEVSAEEEPIRYGIIKQLGSFNLPWSVFHEWIGIARDLWNAPFGSKLGYLIGPPGWSHDGSRDTSDMIRARWTAITYERNDDSGRS